MGSKVSRLRKGGPLFTLIFGVIAAVDGLCAVLFWDAAATERPGRSGVVVALRTSSSGKTDPQSATVVIAKQGEVVAARELTPGATYRSVKLRPGDYEVWVGAATDCHRTITIEDAPLQVIGVHC